MIDTLSIVNRISESMVLISSDALVYDVGDFVIKKYSYNPSKHIKTHNDLDKTGLIPKLITHFKYENHWYLVVERIEPLDSSVRKSMVNYCFKNYFSKMEEIEEKYKDEIEDYQEELAMFNYSLTDDHGGNFGFKDKQIICLDEGCFKDIELSDFVKQMLN